MENYRIATKLTVKKFQPINRKDSIENELSSPIYYLEYLLNRRISVEEQNNWKTPVQCTNTKEFGLKKTYCTYIPQMQEWQ